MSEKWEDEIIKILMNKTGLTREGIKALLDRLEIILTQKIKREVMN